MAAEGVPTAESLVRDALTRVCTVTVDDARAWLGDPQVLWIDVRESGEWAARGIVPGARTVPRGVLEFVVDPASPWHRPDCVPAGRRVLLYCGIGWRSALAADALQRLGVPGVAHLGGGFEAWRAAGGPVEPWAAAPANTPSSIAEGPDGASPSA